MTSRTDLSRLGLGIVVSVLMVACGSNSEGDLLAAESEWSSTGIDDYNLILQIDCFCPVAGSFDVTVQDGQVTEIMMDGVVIEAPGGVTPSNWFTVEGLFDILRETWTPTE